MTVFGIGVDRVLLARIDAAASRWGERFARRILGPGELQIYRQTALCHPRRALQYLAKRFAAKEAFGKAMGTGLSAPMRMTLLDVLNDAHGRPQAQVHGDLALWLGSRRLRAHVSLSDESDAALAFVLLESWDGPGTAERSEGRTG